MRIYIIKITLIFLCFSLVGCKKDNDNMLSENLLCEYLENPIGIDTPKPRFRWKVVASNNLFLQNAYELFVGTDSVAVSKGEGNVWESGRVQDSSNLAVYNGPSLEAFTKYFWGVKIIDKSNTLTPISKIASFETGVMDASNWKGVWITDIEEVDLKPAPYFRKEFELEKKVKRAVAYIAAAGLYEMYINGEKIGNHRLDPAFTRFDKRNLYVAHDVTSQLKNEKSIALGVLLGNGWYNHQSTAVWDFHKAVWRNRPRFLMNLRIIYEDGSSETIITDESWKTSLGPVIFNSIYTGEHYDARLEQPGWNTTGFEDSKWERVIIVEPPSKNIVSQALHPIKNVEEIEPVSIRKTGANKYIYDLGRNISGVSKIQVEGKRGTTLHITHAEILDSVGNIDLSNIDAHYRPTDDSDPFQTDIYILKGDGVETFMPKFNYKGFQYVEIESDQPLNLSKKSLTGMFMYSDVPPVGKIKSSNEIINKIWAATNATYLSNLFGYPTDCPHREKNGWTGDAHIAVEVGLYNYDAITVYEKWMDDHRDEQQPNGVLPAIIPTAGWGYHWANGPDWTSTIAIIPWELYQFYGDSRTLQENYKNIKLYVDHIAEKYPSGLTDWGLGDWVPVEDESPKEFTSSIYYYIDTDILAKAAKLFKQDADHKKYRALAESIKNAINDKYFNKKTGMYGSGFQTELSAPLYWGIVPEEYKPMVAKNLADKVLKDNKHINVGLLGSKTILNALSENGYADLAYEVASQETYPSWGWWIKNGATTLLENWDIQADSDLSRNHIMFGEIGAWFYKALGGIFPDPERPGFKNVLLRPNFVKGLQHFKASHMGPYGEITSSWKKQGNNQIYFNVSIPPNSTGTLHLEGKKIEINGKEIPTPEGNIFREVLSPGKHEIIISI